MQVISPRKIPKLKRRFSFFRKRRVKTPPQGSAGKSSTVLKEAAPDEQRTQQHGAPSGSDRTKADRLPDSFRGLTWRTFSTLDSPREEGTSDIPFVRLWLTARRGAESTLSLLMAALYRLWKGLSGTPSLLASSGRRTILRIPRAVSLAIMALLSIMLAVEVAGAFLSRGQTPHISLSELNPSKAPRDLAKASAALRRKLANLEPTGLYIVVDTAANRLTIMQGKKTLREAVVSCGSGSVLDDPYGDRSWVFDTPRGEFDVKSKIKDPYWVKPDWAFIEEGEIIPRNNRDRIESGVMGEYALGIGGGYFLHGTLYTRLLGRNVTHGCVRIGDEDLEYLYRISPMGTRVYIY